MKHLARIASIVLVMALVMLTPGLAAFAQGGTDPQCTGLAEADCQILLGANGTMDTVSAFSIPAWSLNVSFAAEGESVSLTASGSGEIVLPADPAAGAEDMVLHMVIDEASAVSPDGTESGSFEFILMGNMLYVNVDGEWYGGDISDEMAEGQEAAGEEMGGAGVANPADIALALEGLDLSAAVSTTRDADAEMMGQSMAVFTTNVDAAQVVVTLLTFPPVLQALMGAMGGDTADMEEMELTPEDVQMLGMIFAPMLAGTQISLTRWVGVDDGYIHHIEFVTDLSLDVSMFASGEGAPTEPITGNISLTSDLAGFNESFDITPPADYRPLEELEGEAEALGM